MGYDNVQFYYKSNCFLKAAAVSVNPLVVLLNELGPADVGVSLRNQW